MCRLSIDNLSAESRRTRGRRAFTLTEALVAISLTALAGSVMLLAVEATLSSSTDAIETTIAEGMARQIIDEAMGMRYTTPGGDPQQYPLTPSAWEQNGEGRERYDDTDDFHGFVAQPAEDLWGQPLGEDDGEGGLRHASLRVRNGYFDNWRQTIEVYYVDEDDLSQRLTGSQTSYYRAIEVTIDREESDGTYRELARVRRVFAYIPSGS